MPRISEEESLARREEIIDACERIYAHTRYRDMIMSDIAGEISFGRANIYNYFKNKDEIFLALLGREHERWIADLDKLAKRGPLGDEQLARGLAKSIEARTQMLKLMSMSLYDMEEYSSVEALTELKRVFGRAKEALARAVAPSRPEWNKKRIELFTYELLPFVFGTYPYVFSTEKQAVALKAAGVKNPKTTVYKMLYPVILKLLAD